jgi:hypothetical protein
MWWRCGLWIADLLKGKFQEGQTLPESASILRYRTNVKVIKKIIFLYCVLEKIGILTSQTADHVAVN